MEKLPLCTAMRPTRPREVDRRATGARNGRQFRLLSRIVSVVRAGSFDHAQLPRHTSAIFLIDGVSPVFANVINVDATADPFLKTGSLTSRPENHIACRQRRRRRAAYLSGAAKARLCQFSTATGRRRRRVLTPWATPRICLTVPT